VNEKLREAQADQAQHARAAKDQDKRQVLDLIQQEIRAGVPAKVLLDRVNKHLRRLKRKEITLSTLYRRLSELKKKK
jgi:hypothetical protein